MLYSIKDREDIEKLEELALLQNQVKVVKLQNKLGEQNFHEDIKKSLNLLLNHLTILRKI